jgi:putative hydroxymethylpyrimidine transport system substrate-binding protein
MGVTLDGRVGPANAGLRLAEERGYFEDPAIDIWSGSPVEPAKPVTYVDLGNNEFGVTQLPQLVLAKEKGMPLVAIGSLVSQPTAAMIWLKRSGIHGISDLKGKTVAIPGVSFQEAFLGSVLARAGLTLEDVKVKRVGYGLVSALLTGSADAIFGGSWNIEGAALKAQGDEPVIKRVQDLGVPDYEELVVIVRRDFASEEPKLVHEFMSAVSRGVAAEVQDPEAAVNMIEESFESSPESSEKGTRAGVEATIPLLSKTGQMDPDQAEELIAWMHDQGLIQGEPPVSELLTNKYVP